MRQGFTLIELLVAVLLSTLVLLGMVAIYRATFEYQKEAVVRGAMENGTIYSVQAASRDLSLSTWIVNPQNPNCTSPTCGSSPPYCTCGATSTLPVSDHILAGCTNYDPNAGGQIVSTQPIKAYEYCVFQSTMVYTSVSGTSCPFSNGAAISDSQCTSSPLGGISGNTAITAATGVTLDSTCSGSSNPTVSCPNFFIRRAGVSNIVELHYVVNQNLDTNRSITVNTAIPTEKPTVSVVP